MQYNIVVWPRYSSQVTFKEIADAIEETLSKTDHCVQSSYFSTDKSTTNIILGANDYLLVPACIPENSIIVNFEQLGNGGIWDSPEYKQLLKKYPMWDYNRYIQLLKKYPVWDYSETNIRYLKSVGVSVSKMTIGYSPCLETCPTVQEQKIDVLFCGAMNERRKVIRTKLQELGLKVVFVSNVFGAERDLLIAKSKIVLNIHYYDSKILEVVRLTHLLANKKCVISERGNEADINEIWNKGIVLCDYDEIVTNVLVHWFDETRRHKQEQVGYEFITGHPMELPALKI